MSEPTTRHIIHLVALAGRLEIDLPLEDFDRISRTTPMLVNLKPSGKYLMEDLFYAGGIPALMKELGDLLHLDALTVTGKTMGENLVKAEVSNPEVIRPRSNPLMAEGGTVVLRGNLCPNGAVLKQTAASPELLNHRGPALVFKDREDLLSRIDDPNLPVDKDSVLILQNAGPKGAPGMPEWGQLPIPKKMLEAGVMDMVRISDARMSGTSYGTVVLHVTPESAVGGPLAIIKDGDMIALNVHDRTLQVELTDQEIESRLRAWQRPEPHYDSGYGRLFLDHVLQADRGCDFDFLQGRRRRPERDLPAHYARMGHS